VPAQVVPEVPRCVARNVLSAAPTWVAVMTGEQRHHIAVVQYCRALRARRFTSSGYVTW